jgi:hypothetical protein
MMIEPTGVKIDWRLEAPTPSVSLLLEGREIHITLRISKN